MPVWHDDVEYTFYHARRGERRSYCSRCLQVLSGETGIHQAMIHASAILLVQACSGKDKRIRLKGALLRA
jgi:hypothetical protein